MCESSHLDKRNDALLGFIFLGAVLRTCISQVFLIQKTVRPKEKVQLMLLHGMIVSVLSTSTSSFHVPEPIRGVDWRGCIFT